MESIKSAKKSDLSDANFAMGTAAQRVHRCNKRYYINETMREELEIIRSFIDPVCEVALETPIGHMVLRDPIGDGFSDSCLYGYGAGGYCVRLKIWWHLIWPPEIFLATTKFKDGSDAITINDLEFFGVIVEFSACLVAGSNRTRRARRGSNPSYPFVGRQHQCCYLGEQILFEINGWLSKFSFS